MFFLNNRLKTEFSRNVITLMTGTIIAQLIPIVTIPFLTRIYSPNDFGVFAIFLAITAIFAAISNAQYEQALVLPKKDENAINLIVLGIVISGFLSLLLFVIIILFKSNILLLIENEDLGNLLFFVPVATFLIGTYNSFIFFNIRKKKFGVIANSQILRSSSMSASHILIGLFTLGPIGLIFGHLISYVTGNLVLFKTLKKKLNINKISTTKIKKQAIKYKKFPIFSMPSIFLNSVNLNLINFLITFLFSITTLGFYTLTQRVISIPTKVIGNNISQVYFKEAVDSLKLNESVNKVFTATARKLLLISLPIFIVLFFLAEPIFAFVFGEQWRISGTYAKILIPLASIRFVSSTLSNTLVVFQKQQVLLIFNVFLLIGVITVFFISNIINLSFEKTLLSYSITLSILYLILLFKSWKTTLVK